MNKPLICPNCQAVIRKYSNPFPTADVVIYDQILGIVLVERGKEPFGLALPGGFIEEGESAEQAAIREMKEESNLDVELLGILGVYSKPDRDPRFHTMTITYVGKARDVSLLNAGDDAAQAAFYKLDALPATLCFDHNLAVEHFRDYLAAKRPLLPCAE